MRVVAAAALLASGLVHLDLYFRYGYRYYPDANLGRSFVLNGVASSIVAAALLVRRDAIIRIAGIAVAAATLVAFFMSRNLDKGIFGFTEKGFVPSPQAAIAFIAEIVALVVLLASFVPALHWRRQAVVNPAFGGALAVIVIAVGIVAPVLWARDIGSSSSSSDTAAAATTTVAGATTTTVAAAGGATTTVGGATATTVAAAGGATATTTVAAGATATTTVAAGGATTAAGPSTAAPSASTTAVTIKGFSFDPKAATVTVGETITWTNEDGTDHNVKASDDSFDSGNLGEGATFSQTFNAAGTFDYVCTIHPGMKATVTVTG